MGYDSTIPLRSFSEMERLRFFLDSQAAEVNVPAFADADPVQFPRRYRAVADIEIAALLCSTIAWGKRSMICRDCERLLATLGHEPHRFVLEGDIEGIADTNIHRTFFGRNLRHWLRGLRHIYSRHATLQHMLAAHDVGSEELPAWGVARLLSQALLEANGGEADSRCLPQNLETTALKRLNMALRWLVRTDGIVDIGCWDVIKPSQLVIPLDVHVGNTARALGLTRRRANDRRTALEITDVLRQLRPADPVLYDFALFGAGIAGVPLDLQR